jgi:hypothetical protein
MEPRVYLAVVCIGMFLFCSVSAAGISLNDAIIGGSQDSGLQIPQLPPPTKGSVLQRKVLDSQPYIYKTSDRLLREAEISRDLANEKWDEEMVLYQQKLEKEGHHYSIEVLKDGFLRSPDPLYSPGMIDALENYQYANKQYDAALAATDKKDYERQARILVSASSMYAAFGDTQRQERVENLALAARAMAEAQRLSLPLPAWIVVCGIIGGLLLIQRKLK